MSDLFGAPPAPAPAPPPARRARAPRAKETPAPAAPAQDSRPAAELQVVQAEPPPAAPRAPRGQLVTLHDGRQVNSASEEWRRETLARHLLTLASPERDDWLADWPAEAAVEMRLLMGALRATDRGGM